MKACERRFAHSPLHREVTVPGEIRPLPINAKKTTQSRPLTRNKSTIRTCNFSVANVAVQVMVGVGGGRRGTASAARRRPSASGVSPSNPPPPPGPEGVRCPTAADLSPPLICKQSYFYNNCRKCRHTGNSPNFALTLGYWRTILSEPQGLPVNWDRTPN